MKDLLKINRKWFVQLHGDKELSEFLCSEYQSNEDLQIHNIDGGFYMTSIDFEGLECIDKVRDKSIELIELINGVGSYLFSIKGNISSNAIYSRNQNGGIDCTVYPETIILNITLPPPTIVIVNNDKTTSISSPIASLNKILKSARTNSSKAKIFRLLAKQNLDFVMLYRLFEIIESEIGDQIYTWVNKSTIKNFKHTCNSVASIGDLSRHGKELYKPPRSPLTLKESQELIKKIINNYFELK